MNSADLVARLRDYGLTLEEGVVICDRRVVDEAADRIEALEARLAEAMKVLRPFAAENDISDDAPDDAWLPINSGDMHVAHCTVGA